jgi:hypothetical protein
MALTDVPLNNNLDERLVIGGQVFNSEDIAQLQTPTAAVFANAHATPRLPGVTSGYTPSGSNDFLVYGITISNATNAKQWGLGTADTDVGFNSASGPTNPEFANLVTHYQATAIQMNHLGYIMRVPNGKYLYFYCNDGANATIHIYGFEVSAA